MGSVSPLRAARSILIVEDELLVGLELEQILRDAGWHAIARVNSVSAALAAIATTKIDAAVVDLNLGRESAYPVVDMLAAEGIPFMILTGYAIEDVRQEHRRRTVGKPFQSDELIGALDRAIAA